MSDNAKIYECGPLRYTMAGVVMTVGLLILGFCSLRIASNTMSSLMPLRLKELGASDFTIAFIMTSIAGVLNFTVCPMISFKSDRYRGKRWGRRGVFILGSLPVLSAMLLCFAVSGPAGEAAARILRPWAEMTPATVTIVLIGIIMFIYQFFYMFPASLLYYLYNDVIPAQFVARATGLVQVALTAVAALFDFFFFRHALTHFSALLIAAAIIYTIGMGAMCLLLKEPQLPPLNPQEQRQSRGISGLKTFFRESFSHRIYWFSALGGAFTAVGVGIGTFLIFFYRDSMGLDLAQIGKLNAVYGIVATAAGMVAAFALSVFVDRWHPCRVFVYGTMLQLLFPLINWKWLFFTPSPQVFFTIFLAGFMISLFFANITALAAMPRLVRTFPKSRFGQFCSAQAILRSICVLLMGLVLGLVIDFGRKIGGVGENVYRYLWCWRFLWAVLGAFFNFMMYRVWMQLGGDVGYKAPAPWNESGWEDLGSTPSVGSTRGKLLPAMRLWDGLTWLYPLGAAILAATPWLDGRRGEFLLRALPIAVVVPAVWMLIRREIRRRLPGPGDAVLGGVIHHGILILAAIQQALLLGTAVLQAVIVTPDSPLQSARLWAFESLIALTAVLLLGIGNYFEIKNGKNIVFRDNVN